ncbi:MAG TPA: SIS domain-containing protein [Mesotoga infera]|uniref:Glutamine--fructose-6-phosphate aminotransferase [isomerizing] n=1 Tax=Mesotoga infera TaxID=1236046 RepID=A0A7C1D0N1_9BACT|nr:SIS domain-containing protein [Mesotoga infera]
MSKFMKDMLEQPEAVRKLISTSDVTSAKAEGLDFHKVLFTGMGASLHAAEVAASYLRSSGIDAVSAEMSEIISYASDELLKRYTTIFLISQSGESAELIRFIQDNRDLLRRMALITNSCQSSASKHFPDDRVFLLNAGDERSMGATKTFVNSMVLMLIIAASKTARRMDFSKLPSRMEEALTLDVSWLASLLSESRERILVARGFGIGVGRMARLMFAEVAKISLIFYTGAAFRHGPVELLIDKPVVLTLNPTGATYDLMKELHSDISDKCDLITLSNSREESVETVFTSEGLDEVLASIPMMNVLQKTVEEIARKRGFDPGAGVYGKKVTTKE